MRVDEEGCRPGEEGKGGEGGEEEGRVHGLL